MKDSLYRFVLPAVSPLRLIHAHQNANRILKPYAMIAVDNISMPRHAMYFPVDENGFQELFAWRRATVTLQVFGSNAGALVRRAALLLESETSKQRADLLNVSIGNRLLLSEVPELLNLTQWEERGIYSFEYMFTEGASDEVGLIETVEIKGETIGGCAQDQSIGPIIIESKRPAAVVPVSAPGESSLGSSLQVTQPLLERTSDGQH